MEREATLERIKHFLRAHNLSVVSTVAAGANPEAAVVAFAECDDLRLVFGTSNSSRKYKNILENPKVAFAIGWDGRVGTLQYEGNARELHKEESAPYVAALIAKNPHSKKFMERADQVYFLVTPTWIRLLDMSVQPDETLEVSF